LDQYGVNFILIESDSILAAFLEESDEWQRIYADDIATIYIRNVPQNQEAIATGDLEAVVRRFVREDG